MSFDDVKKAIATLSPEQRTELEEALHALDEGITVEELRELNAMIDEELNDPSPELSVEQVRESIRSLKPGDVP